MQYGTVRQSDSPYEGLQTTTRVQLNHTLHLLIRGRVWATPYVCPHHSVHLPPSPPLHDQPRHQTQLHLQTSTSWMGSLYYSFDWVSTGILVIHGTIHSTDADFGMRCIVFSHYVPLRQVRVSSRDVIDIRLELGLQAQCSQTSRYRRQCRLGRPPG